MRQYVRHTHMHARTHTHTHTHTHTRARANAHTLPLFLFLSLSLSRTHTHTQTHMHRFTVIPCTSVAGLQVQCPRGTGWTYPEVQGRAGIDVAVLVGETLHDLAPAFPMAVHRVMTPRLVRVFQCGISVFQCGISGCISGSKDTSYISSSKDTSLVVKTHISCGISGYISGILISFN
jgi:hypothetical protein